MISLSSKLRVSVLGFFLSKWSWAAFKSPLCSSYLTFIPPTAQNNQPITDAVVWFKSRKKTTLLPQNRHFIRVKEKSERVACNNFYDLLIEILKYIYHKPFSQAVVFFQNTAGIQNFSCAAVWRSLKSNRTFTSTFISTKGIYLKSKRFLLFLYQKSFILF